MSRQPQLSMEAARAIKDLWDKVCELARGQEETADVWFRHQAMIERSIEKVRKEEEAS